MSRKAMEPSSSASSQVMERKVLESIGDGRNLNIRWQTFKITDVSLLDV